MNIEELWIGDRLKIISIGAIGIFAGTESGKAIIDLGDEKKLIDPNDLQITEDEQVVEEYKNPVPKEIHFEKKGFDLDEAARFKPVIDLHMKSLNPISFKLDVDQILNYQLDACADFLDRAGSFQISQVKIIHGKGKGTLKNKVASLLKRHHFVKEFEPSLEGGAFVVYLK